MTDEQIEREVERRFNRLDHLFINRKAMNQAEYDRQARAIGDWADYQYAVLEAVQLLNWKRMSRPRAADERRLKTAY